MHRKHIEVDCQFIRKVTRKEIHLGYCYTEDQRAEFLRKAVMKKQLCDASSKLDKHKCINLRSVSWEVLEI